MRIYLCHTKTDHETAETLRSALEEAGYEIILSGEESGWEAQIDRCPHFVVLLSKAAANSETCHAQWNYWIGKNHPVTLVILLDKIDVPAELDSAHRINAAAMNLNALTQAVLVILPPAPRKQRTKEASPAQEEKPTERRRGRHVADDMDKEEAKELEILESEEAEAEAKGAAPDLELSDVDDDALFDFFDDSPEETEPPEAPPDLRSSRDGLLREAEPKSQKPPPKPDPVFGVMKPESPPAKRKGTEAPPPPQPVPAEPPAPAQAPAPTRSGRAAYNDADTTAAGMPGGLTYKDLLKPPHFSAFYPERIQAGKPYALMTFAFLEFAWNKVREIAAGYSEMMGSQPKSSTAASIIPVDVGSLITFVPQIDSLTFNPIEQTITWQPPYQNATFLFTAPDDLDHDLTGRILVYQGVMITGEIPITMRLDKDTTAPTAAPEKTADFQKLDPIFASYSHRDTPVMEYFRKGRQSAGQKMLVDVYDLRSGEHWAQRLLEMIDESAIFQLFWSEHSAQSQYCRQEWEHALTLIDERPRFIQPVWWDVPMPPPPPELADLHFQRIQLPPVTKFQLAASMIKRWFGIKG